MSDRARARNRQRRRDEARGRLAEGVAAWWLRLKGYRIVGRRVRTPVGEVDLVAVRGRCLAFVEVKYRPTLAQAAEAAARGQLARVRRSAALLAPRYARRCRRKWKTVRVDAVLVAPWRLPRHLCAVAGEDGL